MKMALVVCLTIISCLVYGGGIYKRTGPDGKVFYTDVPPGGDEPQEVKVKVHTPSQADIDAAQRRNSEIEAAANNAVRREESRQEAKEKLSEKLVDEARQDAEFRQKMAPRVCQWVGNRFGGHEVCNK